MSRITVTWSDLAPILRGPYWNPSDAYTAFWGDGRAGSNSPAGRFLTLAKHACCAVVSKRLSGQREREEDVYHSALVMLWQRCVNMRGLAPPDVTTRNAAHWILRVVKNAALDAVPRELDGEDMSAKGPRAHAANVARAEEAYVKIHGARPTSAALAEEMGITVDELHAWRAGGAQRTLVVGAPGGPEADSPVYEVREDEEREARLDSVTFIDALARRVREDTDISPFRRLAFACYELPEVLDRALVDEAAARTTGDKGLARSADETWDLLQSWRAADARLDDIASRRTLAWILRTNEPLPPPSPPDEHPHRRLVRAGEAWAKRDLDGSDRARTTVRMWWERARKDLDLVSGGNS